MGSVTDTLVRDRRRGAAPQPQTESISDLINRCNDAVSKMGNGNPHKKLIHDCARCLRMMCDRMAELEKPTGEVVLDGGRTIDASQR